MTKWQPIITRLSSVGGVARVRPLNAPVNGDVVDSPAARAPTADMGRAELPMKQQDPEQEPAADKLAKETRARGTPAKDTPANKRARPKYAGEKDSGQEIEENIHEIKSLTAHKVSEQNLGRILLQVNWLDDPGATWELEEEIQDGASETLFDYWKKQGGRDSALFDKGSTPLMPYRKYWVYKILEHKREQSAFKFKIQWVGYPSDEANITWENELKLKNCAKELLDEYWASKGGRDQFLIKRRKGKHSLDSY
ncbi:hypothetical protein BKA67DRAFT_327276 [Truncatella angustata]|uniref:Chromo domain-containing protein n=1 Tax=Truncatella angustata TaxID=152316 RepID=A0A9P8UK84_9PEZI|nr:uncharacterized protein BKA67DRAFT_327276 [Truncatella angustata]KAH6653647.1 hypothetical protein BKA67DRAFT_327276 [Truncatella angustata]